jgi:DNA-binding transcriptional LysR family regulator
LYSGHNKQLEMSYKVKLSHLRAYQAIMLTGSVTAAAERLHSTQPALSKQLLSLEEAVDLRLFDRSSGGRMIPTTLGLRFFRQIEGTLSGIEGIPEVAQDLRRIGQARLRVGATPPLMNSALLSAAMKSFLESQPDIRLTFESRPRQDIEEWVANGQIDIGVALLPAENPFVKTLPLMTASAVAVLRDDHPLAKLPFLDPDLIRGSRLILPSRQLLRALIERGAASSGYTLEADIEASSALTCCKFAAEGFGVGICDPFSPTAFAQTHLRVLPWRPQVKLTYGILIPRRHEVSPAQEALISSLMAKVARDRQ